MDSSSSTSTSSYLPASNFSLSEHDENSSTGSSVLAPPIAIIGMSLKLPGDAESIEPFWDMMMKGRCTASEFPETRINHAAHYSPDSGAMGTIRPRKGHFLKEDLAVFDSAFFSLTAAEAAAMDPQQRGLLETTYRALENAGLPMERIYGTNTSVHTGCFTADYMMLMGKDPEVMPKYTATGVAAAMLSNRISSFFGLLGPSLTIDTACSSSLVALDQACQSLRLGQSSMGIVAGCNLIFSLDLTIGLSNMGFLSPDGICHSFDYRANGYARGEGFGAVVIKHLSDAIRDGDTIRAVIQSTRTNQGGDTPLAQPSKEAQARLISDTYKMAGLNTSETRYVEAHGTGTAIGDPLEATAVGTSFTAGRPEVEAVYVSSLKANFGHLEGAAGIASLIKSVLVLERGIIPPLSGLERVNPEIDVDFLNIKFPLKPTPWPEQGLRRVSVNSFGFGGTNSHVILDDSYHYMQRYGLRGKHCTRILPPDPSELIGKQQAFAGVISALESRRSRKTTILAWSANDRDSLCRMISEYSVWLNEAEEQYHGVEIVVPLAHTLLQRRSLLSWRCFAVVDPIRGMQDLDISKPTQARPNCDLSIAFVFTGQGAQWCGMGRELFGYEIFRKSVLDGIAYLMDIGCYRHLVGAFTGELEPKESLDEPGFAQPICTILQIALVDLLGSVNVRPSVVIGHSSGEIAAAYTTGAISRESAWRLAYFRGICSDKLSNMIGVRGAMASVGLSEHEVQQYIATITAELGHGDLTVACVNSPTNVTVSGNRAHVEVLAERLGRDAIFVRILRVPVAYHGPHMNIVVDQYREAIGDIGPGQSLARNPVNMVSSVTGDRISKQELRDPMYWVQNMVSPVKFAKAIQATFFHTKKILPNKLDLSHQKVLCATDILEIGPHATLSGPIRDTLKLIRHGRDIKYFSVLVRKKSACYTVMDAVGHLHCRGYPVNLSRMNDDLHVGAADTICLPNLPQYPFNHSREFWFESRVSRGIRFRKNLRNAFLGSAAPDWSPFDARWRNFLKITESSWIPDHRINDRTIFPAAGMLVMAIEGAAQITSDAGVSAVEIIDATFHSALELPSDSESVEVQLQMLPSSSTTTNNGSQYDWYLRMFQKEWSEVCRGTIRMIYNSTHSNDVDNRSEEWHLTRRSLQHFNSVSRPCSSTLDGQELYSRLWRCGYHFGPTFKRILTSTHSPSGEATAEVEILDMNGMEKPTIVHPATLDGILQIMLPGATDGGADSSFATSLPTRINRLWLSRNGLLRSNAQQVSVAVKIQRDGFRNTTSDIVALAADNSLRVFAEGVQTTSISDGLELSSAAAARSSRLCWNIVHKPDITLLEPGRLHKYLTQDRPILAISPQYYKNVDVILYIFIGKAVDKLKKLGVAKYPDHLEHHYQWMLKRLEDSCIDTANIAELQQDEMAFTRFCHKVRSQDSQLSKIYYRAGEHLVDILSLETNPLSLLFQGNDLSDFYKRLLEVADFMNPLERYLDLLAHKNPSLSVLEVGAGTGGATKHILKCLTQDGSIERIARYSEYCFTDVSPSFFEKGQDVFGEFPRMQYKVFDLEQDPIKQEYEPESFDLIVAFLVLHATTSLGQTMSNLRKVLKPGGKLVAIEITRPEALRAGFIFGLLPGWWLSKDASRPDRLSPCLTPPEWDDVLSSNGFSGIDEIFWDTKDDEQRLLSVFMSTKLEKDKRQMVHRLSSASIVMSPGHSKYHVQICHQQLQTIGIPTIETDYVALAVAGDLSSTLIIILDSPSEPILQSFDEQQFTSFRSVLAGNQNVLWISTSEAGNEIAPSKGSVYGLARTLLSENASLKFTVFEADTSSSHEHQAANLHRIIAHCLDPSAFKPFESEFVGKDGMLQIPRVIEDVPLNKKISEQDLSVVRRKVRFGEKNLRLTVQTPGLLDSLTFTQLTKPSQELGANSVEIRVMAIGVNFKDCLVALGRVSEDSFGTECAGIVEKAGTSCSIKPGDRVAVSALDTYRGLVRCDEALVARIPDQISFIEAAKLPTNFITAYHALVEVGRIREEETVLIHAGAGGTGQAAIQIAQHYGAKVFVTVGSQQKKNLVMSTYGIPEDRIFYSRDTSFAQAIKHCTGGRGVDLILNSLSGDALRASWECIAPYGRFLETGKRDIFSHEKLPMFKFAQNVTFSAVDIGAMTKERPGLVQKALQAVVELMVEEKIRIASPLKVFPLHKIEQAFRYLQGGMNSGCVVVEVDQNAIVQALAPPAREECFRADGTYVIAGGLGGQGKSIARWMGNKGAKNLLILSRQGQTAKSAQAFTVEMEAAGVHVEILACDITNELSLEQCFATVASNLPPIKGCIQAAMVLQDALFDSMTYADWVSAVDPKIRGSWNLHSHLPTDLDFFILLSSTSGIIGSGGQSNYSAGNTYQDALAAFRLSTGQKAVSLNLSVMKEEGYFTDHGDVLEQYLSLKKLVPMSQAELFTVLEHYCNPELRIEDMKGQVVMGLSLLADARSKDEEEANWMDRPLFSHLRQIDALSSSLSPSSIPCQAQTDVSALATSKSRTEAGAIITTAIQNKLARVLSRSIEDINAGKPMQAHGVDSLVAVELRNWFLQSFKADVPVFEILGGGSIEALGLSVAEKMGIGE